MKCASCGLNIDESDIKLQPMKDREGNIKTNKKGDVLNYNFHLKCWEFKEEEKKKKNRLNDYLLKHFFSISAPHAMWTSIINIRNCGSKLNPEKKKHEGYGYDIMLEALIKAESELIPLYEKMQSEGQFVDDEHKGNLILKIMLKNVDYVYKQKKINEEKNETQTQTANFEFINNIPEIKQAEAIEDYDILE